MVRLYVLGILIALLSGCVGQGATVPLSPRLSLAEEARPRLQDRLAVRIVPFEDRRESRAKPRRVHAAGGETQYVIWGGKPGDGLARFLADYLSRRGWDVQIAGAEERRSEPVDVVVTGQVEEFDASVKSLLGSTTLDVVLRVRLQTRRGESGAGDGPETERMTLRGSRHEKLFLYDDQDLERAIELTVLDALDRVMAESTVVNRMWRAKFE